MSNPFSFHSREQILEMWQARAMRAAPGRIGRVLLQSMKLEYIGVTTTSWMTLLTWVFPGFDGHLKPPLFVGHARIELSGRITTMVYDNYGLFRREAIYRSKDEFISEARKLADRLALSDPERVAMFALLAKWISSDLRIGLHGEKLVS